MKKNHVYLRSTFRDIRYSFGRFIAIVLIIFMGVLLFVGIKSVGPNLEQTAENLVEPAKLSDLQVISTGGLTEKDKKIAESIEGTQAELGFSLPYLENSKQLNIQLYSYHEDRQNQLQLIEGKFPKANEVVVDQELKASYPLGTTLSIEDEQLKDGKYKIVGYVRSPIYIDNLERGITTIGDGQLDGFMYLPEEAFQAEAYSILFLSFDDLSKNSFSEEYQRALDKKVEKIETAFATRKKQRRQELQEVALTTIKEQEQELTANEETLTAAQERMEQGRLQLENQQAQLDAQKASISQQVGAELVEAQFADAQQQITQAQEDLENQQAALTKNQEKLAEGKKKISEAKEETAEMATPSYLINNRSSNPGYSEYQSLSDRIDAIANVFPVFFFFIAILITFTTMTRMIEENRKEIGTLKALGYHPAEIASKYILYALLAATLGTTFGVIAGSKGLPRIVFQMMQDQYIFTDFTTNYFILPIGIAVAAALLATLGSSFIVLIKDFREKPAELLLPKAPKEGQRVFLERATPIWTRMSFNQKVTYRNLFRYKARMILTILGIAGCSGLMLAGFGLNDSISAPAKKQFTQLAHYQAIITLNEQNNQKNNKVEQLLADNKVSDFLPIFTEQVNFRRKSSNQTASLFVTDDLQHFTKFISILPQTKQSAKKLTNDGAIISQRLAEIYQVDVGEVITMESDGKEYPLKVAGITENYLGHNVYLSTDYYKKVAQEAAGINGYLVKASLTNKQEAVLSKEMLASGEVLNTTFISDQVTKQEAATNNIGAVVLIFIVLSGTLAFVVLYNLTNINISERERELATIKVLGFYDKEVTMYILRENIIFTFFGILFGFLIGNLLTWFILAMASSDLMVFPMIIHWQGYVISAVMTLVFSGIVSFVTHYKLRGIHMIEALKSND